MKLGSRRSRYLIAAGTVLLLGYGLRLYRLGANNVWWDEAFSIWLARQPVLEVARATARDVHPPLYYVLLHGMLRLAGQTEFVARYISTLAGTINIALLFPLGRRSFGRRPAVFGALILAISRFHIWWSQEARMYSLAAVWVTLAFYLLLRQTDSRRRRRRLMWSLYAMSLVAALYTLYLAALIIPASGLALFILWRSGRIDRPIVKYWLIAVGVGLLLYLPWILLADPSRPGQVAGAVPAQFILTLYLTLLSTGNSTELGRYTITSLLYGLMIGSVLLCLVKARRWDQFALLAPPFLLPLLLAYSLILTRYQSYTPAFEARYFLLFAPLSMLLPAAAVAELSRRRSLISAALAVGLTLLALLSLPPHYADRYLRDQWKSATRIIDAYADPDDKVVILSGDRFPLFLYEYERIRGSRPETYLLPDGVPTLTSENNADQMKRAIGSAERIWLVEIEAHMRDPDGLARSWLEDEGTALLTAEFDHNRLTLFAPEAVPLALSPQRSPPQISVETGHLLGVDLAVREFRPSDTIHLGIYTGSGDSEIRLVHNSGLTLARHTILDSGTGAIVRHDLTFPVSQAMPRGNYTFMDGQTELVSARIRRSDPLLGERDIPKLHIVDVGDAIQFMGYEMTPTAPIPGDTVQVDLYWRAQSPIDNRYTVFAQIIGPFNSPAGTPVWGQDDSPPVHGTFPTDAWPSGLIIRDSHTLELASDAPPALFSLIVGMYDPVTGGRLPIVGQANDALTLQEFDTR